MLFRSDETNLVIGVRGTDMFLALEHSNPDFDVRVHDNLVRALCKPLFDLGETDAEEMGSAFNKVANNLVNHSLINGLNTLHK